MWDHAHPPACVGRAPTPLQTWAPPVCQTGLREAHPGSCPYYKPVMGREKSTFFTPVSPVTSDFTGIILSYLPNDSKALLRCVGNKPRKEPGRPLPCRNVHSQMSTAGQVGNCVACPRMGWLKPRPRHSCRSNNCSFPVSAFFAVFVHLPPASSPGPHGGMPGLLPLLLVAWERMAEWMPPGPHSGSRHLGVFLWPLCKSTVQLGEDEHQHSLSTQMIAFLVRSLGLGLGLGEHRCRPLCS